MTGAVGRTTLWLVALALLGARVASAQPAAPPSSDRWTVSGGLVWTGGYPIGDVSADLRRNATGSTPPPLTLFKTSSSFDPAAGLGARIGFALTPRLTIEGGGTYATPGLLVDITQDSEGEAVSFEGETIAQYTVDMSLLVELPVVGPTARFRPFAIGGASYLRQLHDDRALVETGMLYRVGGGARVFFRGAAGDRHGLGLRADVQAAFRRDGIEFESKTRIMPITSVLLFFSF